VFAYAGKKFGNGDVNCIQKMMQNLENHRASLLLPVFTVFA
jgi:hypothetical protein